MDNFTAVQKSDNLVDDAITVGKTLISTATNLGKGIRDKAKAKEAQKAADAGQYWTLRPYLKSLIPIPQYIINQVAGQGITEYAVLQLPAQSAGSSNSQIIAALKQMSGSGAGSTSINPTGNAVATDETTNSGFDIKKYVPYIAGAIILGLIVYFITKK